MIFIRQSQKEHWSARNTKQGLDLFWQDVGIYSPLLVQTRAEADYLLGMQLMLGKEFTVLLDGVDENKTGTPPTYVKIDIPL